MLHKLLLSRIEACVREPSPQFGALMCQFIPHMTIYAEFIKNHDQSIKVLEACLNSNPSFTDFLENHHFSHDCDAQHLRMLLHQPVTRVSGLDYYMSNDVTFCTFFNCYQLYTINTVCLIIQVRLLSGYA